jgi:hypothetical protein
MIELAGSGLRASVRRINGLAVPENKINFHSIGLQGRKCASDIVTQITSKQAQVARDLVARAGQRLIFITEASGQAGATLQSAVVTERLAAQISPELKAGDAIMIFDPQTYLTAGPAERNEAVQHELWHIFLNTVFPGFAADMVNLQMQTGRRLPYFKDHFLGPYAHFFTRVAALEAGCSDFAQTDAVQELRARMPAIEMRQEQECDMIQAAALFSGLLFSHVYNFALFPATHDFAVNNYQAVRKFMVNFMDEEQIRLTEAFARRLLHDFLTAGQDVIMDGHYARVLTNWRQFAAAVGS